MFLAPCTLPIVPGYLAFIAGKQGNTVRNAIAFVLGFALVFVLMGTFAGVFGSLLAPWRDMLGRTAGAIIILFGLTMLGIRIPFISGERHARLPQWLTVGTWESSFLIGALFALGWSPCIGPILGTVLLYASISAMAWQGAALLGIFSLGLGIPFILSAMFVDRLSDFFAKWGKVTQALSMLGGAILVVLGLLMLSGSMGLLITFGYGLFEGVGYERLLQYL